MRRYNIVYLVGGGIYLYFLGMSTEPLVCPTFECTKVYKMEEVNKLGEHQPIVYKLSNLVAILTYSFMPNRVLSRFLSLSGRVS